MKKKLKTNIEEKNLFNSVPEYPAYLEIECYNPGEAVFEARLSEGSGVRIIFNPKQLEKQKSAGSISGFEGSVFFILKSPERLEFFTTVLTRRFKLITEEEFYAKTFPFIREIIKFINQVHE